MPTLCRILALSLFVWCLPAAATAQPSSAVTSFTVSGDTAEATIDVGGYEVDLTLTFEEAIGLNAHNLGLDAQVIDPLATLWTTRLPDPLSTSIPSALPVVITVEAPSQGGLSFSGVATLEIHTHELSFTTGTELRLFRAPDGGTFRDITTFMGMGSYRARGQVGDFSEFLIVADLRSVSSVVSEKFDRLEDLMIEFASLIPDPLESELNGLVASAESDWLASDPQGAVDELDAFAAKVEENSGDDIPDVWRSARDLTNAAGELRSAAATLQLSLRLAGAS